MLYSTINLLNLYIKQMLFDLNWFLSFNYLEQKLLYNEQFNNLRHFLFFSTNNLNLQ